MSLPNAHYQTAASSCLQILDMIAVCNVEFMQSRRGQISAGAGNDFQKDKQFKKLNAVKDTIEVKVIRAGQEVLVENHDIVVGDLLVLDTGDKIVADGLAVESFGLVVDEASLTGESEPLAKSPKEDPWCRSGTQVLPSSPWTPCQNPTPLPLLYH